MRRLLLGAVVVATAATAPARAEPTSAGDICSWVTAQDGPGHRSGVVRGGPVAFADAAGPVTVTITCTVRLGSAPRVDHTAPAVATATATGTAVAMVPPTPVGVGVPVGAWAAGCTALTTVDAHGTVTRTYWDTESEQFADDPGVACETFSALVPGPLH